MKDCEHYEILLSTWLDGPLEREEQIESLDHLVRCAACRSFYADARALDGLVAVVAPAALATPSPEQWARIASAARGTDDRVVRRSIPAWALQAAAVLVLALGIGAVMWRAGMTQAPRAGELVLGRGGNMTEARFVDLTKEVLEADSRYRRAMQRILAQVSQDTGEAGEVSAEEAVDRPDERGTIEGTDADTSRIPA